MIKEKNIRILAIVVMICLLAGTILWNMSGTALEPENPLQEYTEDLRVDVRQMSGGSQDSSDLSEQEQNHTEQEQQEQKEEEQNHKEQEQNQQKPELQEQKEQQQEEQEQDQQQKQQEQNQQEQNQQEQNQTKQDQEEQNKTEKEDEQEKGEQKPEQNIQQGETPNKNPENDNQQEGEEGEGSQGGDDASEKNPSSKEEEDGTVPEDGGNEDQENPGTGKTPDINEPGLVTDLYSRIISFSQLEEDTLSFYVYFSDPTVNADIKVNYRHKNDHGTGTYLFSSNNRNYETKLTLGTNYITVYYMDQNQQRNFTRFVITYQADKADENSPVKGEHPPVIKSNLDTWEGPIKIDEFTFVVSARTWENKVIYSNNMEVRLDGRVLTNPTGNGTYEYVLHFERPNVGDYRDYEVSVLAWDDQGNSRYVTYHIQYHAHDEGEPLGVVRVVLDATTVGCDVVDECEVAIKSGDSAATAVVEALTACGYEYTSSGSITSDFYISSIQRADAFRGCAIQQKLLELLERDGMGRMPDGTADKLGEHDFTRGSGWLYFINGELCPGKALSAWRLNGGETINLRYTLAMGKDMGLSSYDMGNYSTYCYAWVEGKIIPLGHDFQEMGREEPTEEKDGYIQRTCSKCGEIENEILPATGQDKTEAPPEE